MKKNFIKSFTDTLREKKTFIISMVILAFMYFVIGFVSWVNAILIPYFKIACELTEFWSYLVAFAFYIAYLVMSIPAGILLKKIGFKYGMMAALFFLAAGAFIFVPAAMTRIYGIFLVGLFTMGTGMAILQTTVNPFVNLIGPIEKAVPRMSIMGVFNKSAGILSPLIFAAIILRASDKALFESLSTMTEVAKNAALDELTRRMMIPYACLGVLLLVAGLIVRFSVLPNINTKEESAEVVAAHGGKKHVIQFPYLVLGVLAIFTHVGTQIISIDTIINYGSSMGLNLLDAKVLPSYTLTATIIGYFCGFLFVSRLISQANTLRVCTIAGLIFSILILFVPGHMMFRGQEISISIWFVVLLGLPNSLVFASIWPLAINKLGHFTESGSALLTMALCGNGIFPLIYGHYVESMGNRAAYWVLIPCYVYLVFYAIYGHKIKNWTRK